MVQRHSESELTPTLAASATPFEPPRPPAAGDAPSRGVMFEVEGTLRVGPQAYVLARRLEGHDELTITPGSRLADVPLSECLELPHLPTPATRFEERTVFCLARAEDLTRFPKRARVELVLGQGGRAERP